MSNNYYIEGTSDINQVQHIERIPIYPSFQADLKNFKDLLSLVDDNQELVKNNKAKVKAVGFKSL